MLLRYLFAALAAFLTTGGARADDAALRHTARSINATARVQSIEKTPLPGISAVVTDSAVFYASDDGRYVLYGVLLDTQKDENITENLLALVRKRLLDQLEPKDLIDAGPEGAPASRTVTVFVDAKCQYCRAMVDQLDAYRAAGIRLRFAPWVGGGPSAPAYAATRDAWCATDRTKGLQAAMRDEAAATTTCADEPRMEAIYTLGSKLGIQGTPAIFDARGQWLGGFLSPKDLLDKLQRDHPSS